MCYKYKVMKMENRRWLNTAFCVKGSEADYFASPKSGFPAINALNVKLFVSMFMTEHSTATYLWI